MERAEAEAVYDSGREACVEFILDLAARVEQHDDRLKRLEEQARQDSRTSSKPPSMDPPKSRAQRRAEARAKAKELMRRDGGKREAGGQPGHRGAGRELKPEDQVDEIVDHYPDACGGCGHAFTDRQRRPKRRFGRHQGGTPRFHHAALIPQAQELLAPESAEQPPATSTAPRHAMSFERLACWHR
jgi:hypothetical protein